MWLFHTTDYNQKTYMIPYLDIETPGYKKSRVFVYYDVFYFKNDKYDTN